MCLDFNEQTEISTAEPKTAVPEPQRETWGSGVLYCILATLLGAAGPQQRPCFVVMGLEAIIFPAVSRRSHGIKA